MPHIRNAGTPFDWAWVHAATEDPALNRSEASISRRDTLHKAMELLDLTSLAGDETASRIEALCATAKEKVVAAVCVHRDMVGIAKKALSGTRILVATVAGGFPHGTVPLEEKLAEIRQAADHGADEIDVVIDRRLANAGEWQQLYDEVFSFRAICSEAHLKTILGTGELHTHEVVDKASLVCMMAGADFIKTSTGKERVNASVQTGVVMLSAIRHYRDRTGYKVGFKPAGGIRTASQAIEWIEIVRRELGDEWLHSSLFRIGASTLLSDLERELTGAQVQ